MEVEKVIHFHILDIYYIYDLGFYLMGFRSSYPYKMLEKVFDIIQSYSSVESN